MYEAIAIDRQSRLTYMRCFNSAQDAAEWLDANFDQYQYDLSYMEVHHDTHGTETQKPDHSADG